MVNTQAYREFTLDNGLHVVLLSTATETISGNLRVYHGALHEREGEEGIAHLLEHGLMTGGTEKYDPEATHDIEQSFGQYNAFTGLDKTVFPVDILKEDLQLYLDLVSDLAFNPRLDATSVEQEKGRALREMADAKSAPNFRDSQEFKRVLFNDGPHAYFVPGKESVIQQASVDDLRVFHARGYHANNMDLVLVGGLPDNVEALVKKYFEERPMGDGRKFEFPAVGPLESQTILHTAAPELFNHDQPEESSAKLHLAFIVPPGTHEDVYALTVLTHIFANEGLSEVISKQMGLAYGIEGTYNGTNNAGFVHIQGGILARGMDRAVAAIFDEMEKVKSSSVSDENLQRVVRGVIYGVAKSSESNGGHIGEIENMIDYGQTNKVLMDGISAVTPGKIWEVANNYFPTRDGNYVLMIRDPLKK